LIRNILATYENENHKFMMICDMRRPDLIRSFYKTVSCIKNVELRQRCDFITWQEISNACDKELKAFLQLKYGL